MAVRGGLTSEVSLCELDYNNRKTRARITLHPLPDGQGLTPRGRGQ